MRHQERCTIKVNFLTIGAFEKAELAARIDAHDGAYRLAFVLLGLAAHEPRLILQPSPGTLECIIDGEGQVGVAFVLLGRAPNVNLTAVRQRKPNAHLVPATGLVTIPGPYHY